MSFPIALIKLIAEYVPTPNQLVECELQTKGLPFLQVRERPYHSREFHDEIWNNFPMIYRIGQFQFERVQSFTVSCERLNDLLNARGLCHAKMRADLMAFHLSKV